MRTLTWEARHDVSPLTRRLLECWFGYPLVVVRHTDKAGGGGQGKAASEGFQRLHILHALDAIDDHKQVELECLLVARHDADTSHDASYSACFRFLPSWCS
ncbi:hypothetical protein TIFTF001_027863 [Ficus carica]|uniref:Uncharacterized protein n=1 Tax=Ficus carica TaxID=3494 RepID=A0AA88J0U5_FICCA|nr:hypothetical protein TIFTF001_027863 [Ficus carica]